MLRQILNLKGKIPDTGNVVIHFDSHPDVVIPHESNWILPEACKGFFSTIVWIKPPWSTSVKDGTYHLIIGKDDSGEIGICNNLPLFVSTCSYKSLEKLNDPKEVLLEVVTLGKFVNNEKLNNNNETDEISYVIKKLTGEFPKVEQCFLSIDIDFFSTCNPYANLYEKAHLYDNLKELYFYGLNENMDSQELNERAQDRINQLQELQQLWAYAAVIGLDGEPMPSAHWNDFTLITKCLLAKYCEVDWELIHRAGCSYNYKGEPLVHHLTSRLDIKSLITFTVGGLIEALPIRPAIIILAKPNSVQKGNNHLFVKS